MSDTVRPAIYDKPVLIVDGDEFFRMALISVVTRKLGFTDIIEAASFHEALEHLVKGTEVGLAIFELNTPPMGNWVDLRTVRTMFPDMRVAVVSASQDRDDILMALKTGLHGYVAKGLGAAELERALRFVSDGDIYVPATLADWTIPNVLQRETSAVSPGRSDRLLSNMTGRQREILNLLVAGKSNKDMARSLGLSEGTIKFHMAAVFRVLGSSNRVEAATMGAELLKKVQAIGVLSQDRPPLQLVH